MIIFYEHPSFGSIILFAGNVGSIEVVLMPLYFFCLLASVAIIADLWALGMCKARDFRNKPTNVFYIDEIRSLWL